jgi:uncharacterized repeat protein (TIGR04076 family)
LTNHTVKITVLKRIDPSYVFDGDVPLKPSTGQPHEKCTAFTEGQKFIVGEDGAMPVGFCHVAWADIFRKVHALQTGGTYYPWFDNGVMIACCTDGMRPVSFRLERLPD